VEYKQFIVRAFEREPGKWRASVQRTNGKALLSAMTRRRRAIDKFITGMDATAADAAVRMAIAAIDANAFSRISTRDMRQARAGLKGIEVRANTRPAPRREFQAGFSLDTRVSAGRLGSDPNGSVVVVVR
jgi:predicted neutral ceramidase superfamily lipid hydrolase